MTCTRNNDLPAAPGFSRRDFIKGTVATGVVVGGGLGAFYFGYQKAVGSPLRVGIIGTGDQGGVLIGALNPEFIDVKSIADIRPYNVWRALHGDHYAEADCAGRIGLMAKYAWKTEDEARRHLKVYDAESGGYKELLRNAGRDGIEAVVIALPLHLHAPVALAAMDARLHVFTEKLMARTTGECKEMARRAQDTGLVLATGHQRHYNINYANAAEAIQSGAIGKVHYIRAQWHQGVTPGQDRCRSTLPQSDALTKSLGEYRAQLASARGAAIDLWRKRIEQVTAQMADATLSATDFGYQSTQIMDHSGKVLYDRPALEELIRWRLWQRTGCGLAAELASQQLDAAGILIAAAHDGKRQTPLSVSAMADRPLFPSDRDIEDHVYGLVAYPAPGYDPRDPQAGRQKINVQLTSMEGSDFGGYGELVFGTKGTIILDAEREMAMLKSGGPSSVKVSSGGGPVLDTQASGGPTTVSHGAGGTANTSCGYTEELEHWAWCIRHRDPANQPCCGPQVALDNAVLALTTNLAARQGIRIDLKKQWFDIHRDETPEAAAEGRGGSA